MLEKKATAAANKVANGIDPSKERKNEKIEQTKQKENERLINLGLPGLNSFEYVAREWGSKKVNDWDDKNNRSKRMLERNIFPWLGSKPITDILPKDILACLRRIEDRGTIETAHRTLKICGQVIPLCCSNY
jgi:hypothetical protein